MEAIGDERDVGVQGFPGRLDDLADTAVGATDDQDDVAAFGFQGQRKLLQLVQPGSFSYGG